MTSNDGAKDSAVSQRLQSSLNMHGHSFHYAVLRRLHELAQAGKSQWHFEVVELPVEVRGSGTRIDFVLQRRTSMAGAGVSGYYMLAECKRANPSLSDWCFVRAPYAQREGYVILERAELIDNKNLLIGPIMQFMGTGDDAAYHIAVEVKGSSQGEPSGVGRSAIEDAATQVLRGLNGTVEFLAQYPSLFGTARKCITLVPVVFTTARLWTSNVDLGAADLTTGNVDLSKSDFRQRPWLLYQYTVSPGLKHTQPRAGADGWRNSIGDIVERDSLRTIAIVSSTGIEDFLNWTSYLEVRC